MTTVLPATFDVEAVRADFPVLSRQVNGRPLVYLDNASSSHKPTQVLEAERAFVEQHYSNVHRGVHTLSQEATDAYEGARDTVARFLGAADSREVVFTKNATEAYNLVAYSFGNAKAGERFALGPGDEVCVTEMEHHSNLVPWQMLCERTGATLRWIPLTDDGRLDLTDLGAAGERAHQGAAFVHVSNSWGPRTRSRCWSAGPARWGAFTLVDGAQSAAHMPVGRRGARTDFFVLTGHKMLAPSAWRAVGPAGAARRAAAVPGGAR
jgi:cysteine desulfurase/selenocysteine lyase